MDNIEGKTEILGRLFSSDYFFKIPYYQRPFAWDEDNFETLINDLVNARYDEQYFLGTLVLHMTSRKNYDVVDGQQRLTSLLILTACLRDSVIDEGFKKDLQGKIMQEENKVDSIPEKMRLEVKDRSIFKEMILTRDGTKINKKVSDLAEPENRYVTAIKIFQKKLKELSEAKLKELTKFVNQKCVMITLSTNSFDDAFKLFTIVNDRGKQLRRIDILKAQNISPDLIQGDSVRNRLAQDWESLEKKLGEDTFDSILHMMRFILVKEKPQGDLFVEFEKRIFKKGLLSQGEGFIDAVNGYGTLYSKIFIDKDYLDTDLVENLKFKSMIHIMNEEFEASEWKACILSYAKKFKDYRFYEFVLLIEKLYLRDWVNGTRKDERFGTYQKVLNVIDGASKADEVFKMQKVNLEKVHEVVSARNFYSMAYSKYFLLRLEVLASEQEQYREFTAKSIEHVFPKTVKADSAWSTDPNISEHASVVDSIGNLVLLSKSKNSSASNHEFSIKKERYLKTKVSDYPRSLQILGEPTWTIAKIKSNTGKIAETILNDP